MVHTPTKKVSHGFTVTIKKPETTSSDSEMQKLYNKLAAFCEVHIFNGALQITDGQIVG